MLAFPFVGRLSFDFWGGMPDRKTESGIPVSHGVGEVLLEIPEIGKS